MGNDMNEKHFPEKYNHCDDSFLAFSLRSSADGIHLHTNIVVVIINLALLLLGIVANVLVITAYAVNKRLRTSPNMLLVVLAVSDVMVTAVVQPLYVARKLEEIFGNRNCHLGTAIAVTSVFCCGVSLATIFILSIERFIILAYPYRHRNITNPTRLKGIVALLWLLASIFSVSQFKLISSSVFLNVGALAIIFSVSTVVSIWVWIYRLTRRHKIRIKNSQTPSDMTNKGISPQKMLKTTRTSFLIVVAVLLSYLPVTTFMFIYAYKLCSFSLIYLIVPWANTIVYAKSSFNPLLLIWRKKAFKEAIKEALSKIVDKKATVNPTF